VGDTAAQEETLLGLRLVNVEIRSMVPEREALDPDEWDFFCECGKCSDRVRLYPAEFDIRIIQGDLVLAPGHVFAAAAEARRVARRLRKESHALQAQARQAVRRAQQGVRQARVLLVDDSADFRRTAASVVSVAGWVRLVGSVSSGEAAIRLLPHLKPDLVVLDVQMPGLNGVDAARIIHQYDPATVVVLMSADASVSTDLARAAGAAAVLRKADLLPGTLDALWLTHRAPASSAQPAARAALPDQRDEADSVEVPRGQTRPM